MSSSDGWFETHNPPPPPYAPQPLPTNPRILPRMPRMPYHDGSNETTSLVNTHKGGKRAKCWFLHHLFPIFFILSLWVTLPMVYNAVRYEKIEWERVRDEMTRDIARLRGEKVDILDEVQQLRVERNEKRREWELEREEHEKRRRGHVPFWGQAQLINEQCPANRFRQYEARMYNLLVEDDWYAACMKEPIQIAGRNLTSPQSCINRGLDNGVRGYWSIEVDTRECPTTIWDRIIFFIAQLRKIIFK